ncbi:YtxH domain-containing protein [Evansella sp. LMS18]|jgi:gas vesicle protein|uniref:YtxH domain-containing protein n=1 Tax=Evansella sp. LMS18 TaxID=2924033 RepID=UPI0020D04AC4|nr:YtxH domain-containing protein [Evansella sp. LMS18]UTR10759.1 YtxH domain-containing protein [Evansella sp. LMS18]
MDKKQQQGGAAGKIVAGMAVGALAGAAVMMLNSSTRSKVMDSTNQLKESAVNIGQELKEDPEGKKDQFMERVQNATDVLKGAVKDLQGVYEIANEEVLEQVKEVKDDAKEVFSTAKDAGEELQNVGSQVKDAKEELVSDSESGESSSGDSNSTNHTITDRPV